VKIIHNLKRYFFTLIELLAVITIISILASILLPVLKNAREKSKQMVCMNKLKQYHLTIGYYLNDSNSYMPPNKNGDYTPLYLYPYSGTGATYTNNPDIFVCPDQYPFKWIKTNSSRYAETYGGVVRNFSKDFTITSNPSIYILFSDTVSTNPSVDGHQRYNIALTNTSSPEFYIHARHLLSANNMFIDGHVAARKWDGYSTAPSYYYTYVPYVWPGKYNQP